MDELIANWLEAKEAERKATEARRLAEDALMQYFAEIEGIQTRQFGEFEVKVTGRYNRKVDAEKLQELAVEAGLQEHLQGLFNWKPEINMAAWRAADESITRPLLGAITTKPGRPSFQIKLIGE